MMLMTRVMTNRVRPTANRVLYCSDPCTLSPSAAEAMNLVIVCPPSSGLVTILAWLPAAIATIIAFVVGYLVIAFLMQYLKRGSFLPFVIYRVALGILIIVLLLLGVVPAESAIMAG